MYMVYMTLGLMTPSVPHPVWGASGPALSLKEKGATVPAAPAADCTRVRGQTSRSSRINVNMKRNFSNQHSGAPTRDAGAPGELSVNAPASAPAERPAAAPDSSGDGAHIAPLEAERSQFTRRLESFGLGERQSPLLTDCVWSLDADGNLR